MQPLAPARIISAVVNRDESVLKALPLRSGYRNTEPGWTVMVYMMQRLLLSQGFPTYDIAALRVNQYEGERKQG